MGEKFEISGAVGDALLKKFGRRMRIVSESDFKAMASALKTLSFMTGASSDKGKFEEVPSERIRLLGRKKG